MLIFTCKPKKIIELNQDGTSSTFNFTYNGEKIISIESEETSKKFTYFGNLITQIIELNKKEYNVHK